MRPYMAHRRHLSGKAALELAVEVGDRAAGDSFFDHQEAVLAEPSALLCVHGRGGVGAGGGQGPASGPFRNWGILGGNHPVPGAVDRSPCVTFPIRNPTSTHHTTPSGVPYPHAQSFLRVSRAVRKF